MVLDTEQRPSRSSVILFSVDCSVSFLNVAAVLLLRALIDALPLMSTRSNLKRIIKVVDIGLVLVAEQLAHFLQRNALCFGEDEEEDDESDCRDADEDLVLSA